MIRKILNRLLPSIRTPSPMEFVAHRTGGECEVEGCTHYSDCDVYFEDGTSRDMCSMHSWDACGLYHKGSTNPVIQVVPQHGGDMNQDIE